MIGTEEAVREAQKELEELIKSLVRLLKPSKTREGKALVLSQCLNSKYIYHLVTGQRG